MKVSLNWAQQVSNVDLKSVDKEELLKKIGAQLGAIEEVIEWGPRYDGIVIVKVVSCEPHPNADKLHVCRIDDGGAVKDAERGEDDLVQVVCGAPNVAAGMLVAWLPPGSTVPSTLDKDPYVLGARELRGVISNGMLASAAELGISDDHDGILEIRASDVGEELAKPGTPFKQLYGLDDTIIDCENKMFTHRPDCFGILGVARELAGITNQKFVSPDWYLQQPVFKNAHDIVIKGAVSTDLVPRLMTVAMQDITVGSSPLYMQAGLSRVGIKPINNIVDVTNWLMHLTGQPLHAYDYDKLKAVSSGEVQLHARLSTAGEKINLLNGKQVELDDKTIVIATDKQVVGIAGVMGGSDTEVDATTKNIVIEVATFNMYAIRKAAMKYGLFTDAVTRFNKGQSPLQNDRVLAEAMKLMNAVAGARQASDVVDYKDASVMPLPAVAARVDFINTRLGSDLDAETITDLLENVECLKATGAAHESRSYLMGIAADVTDKLERIGVTVVERTPEGNYKLIIPVGSETEYEKIVSWEMQPGFWNEYIGARNVFMFKSLDLKTTRYEVSDDSEHEIVEMCRTFANDYYTSLEAMLMTNAWYKPLLPLKKAVRTEAADPNVISIVPPFWRRDLEYPEDLVEEIGRLLGFDRLPVALPSRNSRASKKDVELEFKQVVRTILASAGANEVLTYSFVHGKLLDNVGQNKELAFHVRNAISPDLQYYRMSLTPSLLDKVYANLRGGYDHFALFEIGKTHNKVHAVTKGEVPEEFGMLSLVVTAATKSLPKGSGAAFYEARAYLDFLAEKLGLELSYTPISAAPDYPVMKPFDPTRSAFVGVKGSKTVLGVIGEYTAVVRRSLKLSSHTAGFEIGTTELIEALGAKKYTAATRYPKSQQDVTYETEASSSYAKLSSALLDAADAESKERGYIFELAPGDIFLPEDGAKKRTTFHLAMHHTERTLTTEEVNRFIDQISKKVQTDVGALKI